MKLSKKHIMLLFGVAATVAYAISKSDKKTAKRIEEYLDSLDETSDRNAPYKHPSEEEHLEYKQYDTYSQLYETPENDK